MDQLVNEVIGLALGTARIIDNADWFNKTDRYLALEKVGFNAIASKPDKVTLRKDLPPDWVYGRLI